jgi:hypothetical protein
LRRRNRIMLAGRGKPCQQKRTEHQRDDEFHIVIYAQLGVSYSSRITLTPPLTKPESTAEPNAVA